MRNAMLREPTHPGIFLKEDYMIPLGLSQAKVAQLLHVNKRVIHELCTQKRGISALMALKLEKLFGIGSVLVKRSKFLRYLACSTET